jgi:hypothetical protein
VAWPLALSALAWLVIFASVPPTKQNFPLHDDWAFSRGAMAFFHGEGIHYSQWASMPQLGQWLWSLPFLAVLGESHFSLRVSTVVLGWLALLAFYDLLRQAEVPPGRAAFAVAALGSNPWFFLSQGTFMTDVPSLAFALGALCLYGRALSGGSLAWLAAAAGAALLGAITRQNTIAAGLATGVLLAGAPRLGARPLWWLAVLVPVLVAAGVHLWFGSRPDVRPMPLSWPAGMKVVYGAWVIVNTLGLVAIPVLLLDPRPATWRRFALALLLLLLVAFAWRKNGQMVGRFPYTIGTLDEWGAFTDHVTVGFRDRLLTPVACLSITVAGCAGAAALVSRAGYRIRSGRLLLLFSVIQVPMLLAVPVIHDRYLEFLMPAGLYLATSTRPVGPWHRLAGGTALALSAVLAVGLMHDWLAWNEARWAVGRRALERGIEPRDVEGGFEWDGWFAPALLPPPRRVAPAGRILLPYSAENFAHTRGHYALSLSVLPNTEAIDSEPYYFWLQPGKRKVYLIKPDLPASVQMKQP